MRLGYFSLLAVVIAGSSAANAGQQAPAARYIYPATVTDPACPVVANYGPPIPVTRELRVLYFPTGKQATIRNPKSLALHIVLESGSILYREHTIPFVRQTDDVWVATVPINEQMPQYAAYWVDDPESKQSDTNGGKYFDVHFCNMRGEPAEMSVQLEAESYTGVIQARGIDRPMDYAKAIQILEGEIRLPMRGQDLLVYLWAYKLQLGGDTPQTRSALIEEINRFTVEHSAEGFSLLSTLNFASMKEWMPKDTIENLVQAIDKTNPEFNARFMVLRAEADRDPDLDQKLEKYRQLLKRYPDDSGADDVRLQLFYQTEDLAESERLFSELLSRAPNSVTVASGVPYMRGRMAEKYLDARQQLPKALALLDEAEKQLGADNPAAKHNAVVRADILVRLGRPTEAAAILQPRATEFKLGSSFYVYGRALEATGNKKAALDAYLQAVVLPSHYQQDANTALEQLWKREKLGTPAALQAKIEGTSAANFAKVDYKPHILARTAPELDLTTLQGERLTSAQLRGKKIVLDFWAVWCGPCRTELKPLQDFQQKHPEVVVVTTVNVQDYAKELTALIRDEKLTTLRISPMPAGLMGKYGVFGFPYIFVIDEKGFMRVQHSGGVPDVERYLDADFEAIAKAGPVRESASQVAR